MFGLVLGGLNNLFDLSTVKKKTRTKRKNNTPPKKISTIDFGPNCYLIIFVLIF